MRHPTILADWSDIATRARIQHVLNDKPMPWDTRPSFYVAWPNNIAYGMVAGNTVEEALERLP